MCATLVRIDVGTKVVVVQHPREADNAIGTAWMVERTFGARRIVGVDLEHDRELDRALSDPDAPPILLSPAPDAIDLRTHPPRSAVTLVVIDGTWAQARQLLSRNPRLRTLPRYAFAPAQPSNYRIRREPSAECVSTVEATVAALEILESRGGRPPFDGGRALAAFEAMVDRQIAIARDRNDSRHRRAAMVRREKDLADPLRAARRAELARRRTLTGRQVVVVHAEANCWPRGHALGPYPELVQLVAERLSDGARFSAIVRNAHPISPALEKHARLSPAAVAAGITREALRAQLAAFVRDDDEIFVWGHYLLALVAPLFGTPPFAHSVAMKAEAALDGSQASPPGAAAAAIDGRDARAVVAPERLFDLRRFVMERGIHQHGDAADLAARLGIPVDAPWAEGRAGARLSASVAVARALARGTGLPDGKGPGAMTEHLEARHGASV